MNYHKISEIPSYFNLLKNEIKLYQNMSSILDKIEQDGNTNMIAKTFEKIFNKEMIYAISGQIKRIKKNKRKNSFQRFQNSINK